jgi:hypothetical protein
MAPARCADAMTPKRRMKDEAGSVGTSLYGAPDGEQACAKPPWNDGEWASGVPVVGTCLNPSVMPWRETPWHRFVKAEIYVCWLCEMAPARCADAMTPKRRHEGWKQEA